MSNVYVSLNVDNLDHRKETKFSDRISTYEMSNEDIDIVLNLIRKYKYKDNNIPERHPIIIHRTPENWEDAAS